MRGSEDSLNSTPTDLRLNVDVFAYQTIAVITFYVRIIRFESELHRGSQNHFLEKTVFIYVKHPPQNIDGCGCFVFF